MAVEQCSKSSLVQVVLNQQQKETTVHGTLTSALLLYCAFTSSSVFCVAVGILFIMPSSLVQYFFCS